MTDSESPFPEPTPPEGYGADFGVTDHIFEVENAENPEPPSFAERMAADLRDRASRFEPETTGTEEVQGVLTGQVPVSGPFGARLPKQELDGEFIEDDGEPSDDGSA